ncbi:MAG: hypothetical protein K0R17_3927, partial [Rariglobus sp.]|nr:hypothetical protein [Rariglobus sp.]
MERFLKKMDYLVRPRKGGGEQVMVSRVPL